MNMYLLIITLLSIVIVILGVSWWRWHAFISLTIASLFLAIMSGMPMDKIVSAYETGSWKCSRAFSRYFSIRYNFRENDGRVRCWNAGGRVLYKILWDKKTYHGLC